MFDYFIYQNSHVPANKNFTRVKRKKSAIVYIILTNSFVNTNFETIMFKTDVLNNFPVCFLESASRTRDKNKAMYINKRLINNNAIEMFKQK